VESAEIEILINAGKEQPIGLVMVIVGFLWVSPFTNRNSISQLQCRHNLSIGCCWASRPLIGCY